MSDPPQLLGEREIVERRCSSCSSEWKLWGKILKQTESVEYGDLALRGLKLLTRVADFHYPITELTDFDYDLLEIANAEVKKRRAFHEWRLKRESEGR